MKITEVTIRRLRMELVSPFRTSFGTEYNREFLLLEARDESGTTGWGESVAMRDPYYNEETCETNWHMLEQFIIPEILHRHINHPDEISDILAPIRRNNMAKSTIEGAIWDIYATQTNQSLAAAIGGKKDKIEVGVSIGIQHSIEALISLVDGYITEGYKRIKVKIKPGWDIDVIRQLRAHFPDIQMMADANSAYTLADIDTLKQLDEFNLTMIEQPLAADDIVDHATLQKQLTTPICLDESILSLDDARKAVELGSTKIINIKIGRVGGITEAKKIHDYCKANGIPVWCGGMLESGIGRAHNIALTTLDNFILPGDTSGSDRYWKRDIIQPAVISSNGYIDVPQTAGIGYTIDHQAIEDFTIEQKTYR